MKSRNAIGLCIIIGLGAFGTLGSFVLFFIDTSKDFISVISSMTGIIGTAASIVLSVVAMVYSNKSSKDAEESLSKVTNHYKTLCEALAKDEIVRSLGVNGIHHIINKHTDNATKTE